MDRLRGPRVRIVPPSREEEAAFREAAYPLAPAAFDFAVAAGARVLRDRVWLDVPIDEGRWVVAYRVVLREGRPLVAEMTIRPNGARLDHGVTARRVVAQVKVSEHLEQNWKKLRPKLRRVYGRDAGDGTPGQERRRRGRPVEWDDIRLAKLAARYVALREDDRRTEPIVDVLADGESLSQRHVSNLLTAARKRRLLTRSRPGIAGGELTTRARVLLALDEEPLRRGGRRK